MTIKAFTDLPGFKEANTGELAQIGIASVDELRTALNDEARFKEIIKTLSGVGPKTAENWRNALSGGAPAEPETVVEAVEAEVIEEHDGYRVKPKPELDDEQTDALAKRAVISGRRPAFKRQEWFRYSALGDKWRCPKGRHSKLRVQIKRRPPRVRIGYRGPEAVRGLHPSGFEEVMVFNTDGLEGIDPKKQAVRIGGTVGYRKRTAIEDRADELGIRILNRTV
jgi:large subunit ribosomal protein L32e